MDEEEFDERIKAVRMILDQVEIRNNTLNVELYYPRSTHIKFIEVGLMDIRAADSIRISYDFDRDGWIIEQASIFEWESGETDFDEGWQEVAFIESWALDKRKP